MLMDEDFQRLWSLLAELSGQLTANREQCDALKRQAEDLKRQAVHTGTGYVLRRFNVDLSQEQFDSELERMNAQLVVENQTLQYENRQLSVLLKDYETTLEQVMSKFRAHAHSSQNHELDLVRHYEQALLSALEQPSGGADPLLANQTAFSSLQHLSRLVQRALRSLQGEEDLLLSDPSTASPSSDSSSSAGLAPAPPAPVGTDALAAMRQDPLRPPDAYRPRARDPASGGYIGTRGTALSDPALQDAIELETLRRENAHLRELLSIAQEDLPRPGGDLPLGPDGEAGQGGHGQMGGWDDGEGRRSFESEAMSRTGAGVVVPDDWIKGADQETVDRLAAEGMMAAQV